MSNDTARISLLNDQLRQRGCGGGVVMTPGIAALGPDAIKRLIRTIGTFDDFCKANYPNSEHDFGAFDFDGQRCSSRSTTITIKLSIYIRQMRLTRRLPNA